MPGRPMRTQNDEERVRAIDRDAAAAHKREVRPKKGTKEARDKMAKVRAAKGKHDDDDRQTERKALQETDE